MPTDHSDQRHPGVAFARTGSGAYAVLCALFCGLLIISNIAATKGIAFGPIITDGGAFVFPLTYVIGDVISEVFGLRAMRRTIALGFVMALLASLTFWLVQISPAVEGYENQAAFEAVLGVVPIILLASMAGYLLGQFLNAVVLVKIKQRTREQHLWARLIGSTVVGEFGDTLVFCAIAASFIGIETFGQFLNYLVVGFLYKTLLEVVLLPITYRVIAVVKRREPSYAQALADGGARPTRAG
ncbi:queuosine precursor transporter [Nakamurella sp. YIM 132084]|uniref:Probable queuosine precursor transporter n=1 Tax=Nakamurella leprariae TaxID=2803911 RepID=A0A939C2A4_9ACTN|nr:queuosine precursor transporter [Nakamurella leprariae]